MIKTPLSTMIGGAFWMPDATMLGSSSQNFDQLIKSLFASSEQGFAYDPNDLSTLYQDAAGTIPVTAAGQPVGLMLDKSSNNILGDYLPGISVELTPLNGTATANGDGTFTVSNGGYVRFRYNPSDLINAYWYQVDVEIISTTGNYCVQWCDFADEAKYNSSGIKQVVGVRNTYDGIYCFADVESTPGQTTTFRLLGVKRLAGNHAYQLNSSMRPLLQDSPHRLEYDGIDDTLVTILPEQLTGCTVVRSIPNVGTQILTNQTVPSIFYDNIDNCGLLVINRALTVPETAQITQLFNKAAGV